MKVTVKDIPVRYDGERYKKGEEVEIKDAHFDKNLFLKTEEEAEVENDLFELSESELKKVNKDVIKAFLDAEEIEYDSNANKDELISLIVGENNGQ